jgi:hypothetical protein
VGPNPAGHGLQFGVLPLLTVPGPHGLQEGPAEDQLPKPARHTAAADDGTITASNRRNICCRKQEGRQGGFLRSTHSMR